MLGNLTGWHLLIVLAVVLLIFGAAKLPALARSMGQSARILKSEMKAGTDPAADAVIPDAAVPIGPEAPVARVTPIVSESSASVSRADAASSPR